MKIECKLHREGGTYAEVGGVEYHFEPQPDGSHVADVTDEDHIARFLAIPEGYKIHGSALKSEPKKPAPKLPESLLGSSVHAATYEIGGKTVLLGDVVAAAYKESGLTVEEWNAASEDDRHQAIDEQLDLMAANAGGEDEMAELRKQHLEKFGVEAHPSIKLETLKKKLAE